MQTRRDTLGNKNHQCLSLNRALSQKGIVCIRMKVPGVGSAYLFLAVC